MEVVMDSKFQMSNFSETEKLAKKIIREISKNYQKKFILKLRKVILQYVA